jgi:hypothetical protein
VVSSSQVDFLIDEGEDSEEDEDFINEGIVGKKFIAMKHYIRDASTSKNFKEINARRPQENRLFLHRSESSLL